MNEVITVTDFVGHVNEYLDAVYEGGITIEGEISGFKIAQGKWVHFDLKDEDTSISCFMVKYQLKVELEDGMKVRVTGAPKVTKWGKFSFTVRSVSLSGEGEMKRAYELLKAKLEAEGLFDPRRKRLLPKFPHVIGLVTSAQSAAYRDFMKIVGERWGGIDVQLIDVQVQGAPAPEQIATALGHFNQVAEPPDVLVLIRGGGSLEDLQAFNSEAVARAVAASRTPIIVGVGHEVDTSLADYAADVRAATPTDAATKVVPDRREMLRQVSQLALQSERCMQNLLTAEQQKAEALMQRMEVFLRLPQEQILGLERRLWRFHDRISHSILSAAQRLDYQTGSLIAAVRRLVQQPTQKIENIERLLKSANPQSLLSRGYAIAMTEGGVLKDSTQVSAGDEVVIKLHKGKLNTKVEDAQPE